MRMARNMYSSAIIGTPMKAKAMTAMTNHLSCVMVKICWSAA